MTQWYKLRCFFAGHDARDPGNSENIAFFMASLQYPIQSRRLHYEKAFGYRFAPGRGFVADIHHTGFTILIEMGKLGHVILKKRL